MAQLIRSWEDAEKAAVLYLRASGYPDAQLTSAGRDGGADVRATGLIAQVKAEMVKTASPVVQQTCGVAAAEDAVAAVFSLAGFTNDAIVFAGRAGVSLFTFNLQSDVEPVNDCARLLGDTPFRRVAIASEVLLPPIGRPHLGTGVRTPLAVDRPQDDLGVRLAWMRAGYLLSVSPTGHALVSSHVHGWDVGDPDVELSDVESYLIELATGSEREAPLYVELYLPDGRWFVADMRSDDEGYTGAYTIEPAGPDDALLNYFVLPCADGILSSGRLHAETGTAYDTDPPLDWDSFAVSDSDLYRVGEPYIRTSLTDWSGRLVWERFDLGAHEEVTSLDDLTPTAVATITDNELSRGWSVLVLDIITGEVRWTAPGYFRGVAQGVVIVETSLNNVTAFDAMRGTPRWSMRLAGGTQVTTAKSGQIWITNSESSQLIEVQTGALLGLLRSPTAVGRFGETPVAIYDGKVMAGSSADPGMRAKADILMDKSIGDALPDSAVVQRLTAAPDGGLTMDLDVGGTPYVAHLVGKN